MTVIQEYKFLLYFNKYSFITMNKFHIKIRVNTVDDRLSSDLKREIDTVGVGRRGVVEEVAARADGVRSQSRGAIVVARGGHSRQGRQTRQGRQGPG